MQQEQYRNLLTQTAEYAADYIGAAGEMPAFPNGKALLALQEFIEALSPNGMEASLRTHTATRLHHAMAGGGAVARPLVHVDAGETVGAVVAVAASRAARHDQSAVHFAGERIGAWVLPEIALVIFAPLMLPVHRNILLHLPVRPSWPSFPPFSRWETEARTEALRSETTA